MNKEQFNVFTVNKDTYLEDHSNGSYYIGKEKDVDVDNLRLIAVRLNELNNENQQLKNILKEIGYEVGKYSYEVTGKRIEDYNTEDLLTSLLQDIMNSLQTGEWVIADYKSDFSNDLDLKTNEVVEKNISMNITLKRVKERRIWLNGL